MVAAAYLPPDVVNATEKLALMKLCDSADEDSRLAVPTQRRLVAWVGLSEKRTSTVITRLVAKGLVERVSLAREGRAAVYKVFPDGVPITPDREALDERLVELRARPTNPKLARKTKCPRRRPEPPARTYEDMAQRPEFEGRDKAGDVWIEELARRAQKEAQERGFRDGNPQEEGEESEARVSPGKPSGFREGNREGFANETPSFPSSRTSLPASTPPTPKLRVVGGTAGSVAATSEQPPQKAGETGCPKHRTAPGATCRSCGTTVRAERERGRKAAEEAARAANRGWWARWRADEALRQEEGEGSESASEARRAVREALSQGRDLLKEREVNLRKK